MSGGPSTSNVHDPGVAQGAEPAQAGSPALRASWAPDRDGARSAATPRRLPEPPRTGIMIRPRSHPHHRQARLDVHRAGSVTVLASVHLRIREAAHRHLALPPLRQLDAERPIEPPHIPTRPRAAHDMSAGPPSPATPSGSPDGLPTIAPEVSRDVSSAATNANSRSSGDASRVGDKRQLTCGLPAGTVALARPSWARRARHRRGRGDGRSCASAQRSPVRSRAATPRLGTAAGSFTWPSVISRTSPYTERPLIRHSTTSPTPPRDQASPQRSTHPVTSTTSLEPHLEALGPVADSSEDLLERIVV
jgi:hypothetical protein